MMVAWDGFGVGVFYEKAGVRLVSKQQFSVATLLSFFFILPLRAFGADALLIGAESYRESPLSNPGNDVALLSGALLKRGWNVESLINPTSAQLKARVSAFLENRKNSNSPVLVYFSGHGLQFKGENYLLPVDALSSGGVLRASLSITELGYLSRNILGPKIFIVDACRSSPLGRDSVAVSSGLNSQDAPPNSLIAYATSPGDYALDGPRGGNSPYVSALAAGLTRYSKLDEAFGFTRRETMRATNGKQMPWESSSLFESVLIGGGNSSGSTAAPQVSASGASTSVPRPRLNANNLQSQTVVSFDDALDYILAAVENSNPKDYYIWSGKLGDERDKSDFVLSVDADKKSFRRNPRGALFSAINTLQDGRYNPACRKGKSIDPDCVDFGRALFLEPNMELSLKLSKMAYENRIYASGLANHYAKGWLVEKNILKAYDLYVADKDMNSEYWWTDINRMVQEELAALGSEIEIDGDFGPSSCEALVSIIGRTPCSRTVSRKQIEALEQYITSRKKSIL